MLIDIIGYRRLEVFGIFLLTADKHQISTVHPTEIELITLFKYKEIPPPYLYWAFWFLPFVFPDDWEERNLKPQLKYETLILKEAVLSFFSLSIIEFNHLFVPFRQIPYIYSGIKLQFDSEAWEIGVNILSFLKTIVLNN
ncbi:MAG: hypothetical protein M3Q58_01895 [Bacteroidota bacterium]|nr:hypothetical protein [Bacteroidota bacterium]